MIDYTGETEVEAAIRAEEMYQWGRELAQVGFDVERAAIEFPERYRDQVRMGFRDARRSLGREKKIELGGKP